MGSEIWEPPTRYYPSGPVAKRNNQQTTHTSHYRSRPVEFSFKAAMIKRFRKKLAISNKFFRTHLCRSQFLEHRPHCRSEEQLKSVASKSCQLVDRRANDRVF